MPDSDGHSARSLSRRGWMLVAAGLSLPSAQAAAAPAAARAGTALDPMERGVVRTINAYRARSGLPRLRVTAALNRAAARHSRDMLVASSFAHQSPNGTTAADRIRRFYPAGTVGETLAFVPWGIKAGGARAIVRMWLASPGHRAVLLSASFRRLGVAHRMGRIASMSGHFVTADFASPRG